MIRIFNIIDTLIEYLVAAIFIIILCVGGYQIFGRYVMNSTPTWSSEVQIYGHIYIVFLAIPIAYRRGAHLYMDSLRKRFPEMLGKIFSFLVEMMWLAFGFILIFYGWKIIMITGQQTTPGMGISMSYPYAALPISGIYLVLMVIRNLIGDKPTSDDLATLEIH